MTPYFEEDGITIYHGDCRELLPDLEFSVLLSDPPYGIDHPTNYAERGRGNLANCSNYPKVHQDNEPFDPTWMFNQLVIDFERDVILWGANYYADKLPNV